MQSFRSILHAGVHYKQTFPTNAEIVAMWPERRIIHLTKWAERWLSGVAVIGFTVQLQFNGADFFLSGLAQALFILSLPVHGWYWLGLRSLSPLTPAAHSLYQDYSHKLVALGVAVPKSSGQVTFQQLADVLALMQQHLTRDANPREGGY